MAWYAQAFATFALCFQGTYMAQPPKDLSLSRIHDVYSGSVGKPKTEGDGNRRYQTTHRFAREAGHSGTAPNRPLAPGSRKPR